MRILIVAHGHPDFSTGGAEIAAFQLFKSFREMTGVTAFFLAAAPPGAIEDKGPGPITPYRDGEFLLRNSDFDDFSLTYCDAKITHYFRNFINKIRVNIIHFHHYIGIGFDIIEDCSHFFGIKTIVTLHEYRAICNHHGLMVKTGSFTPCLRSGDIDCADCFPEIGPRRFAQRREGIQRSLARIDLFVAPSAFLRQRYVDWGVPAAAIRLIENAADEQPVVETARCGAPSLFGFFGQMHPFKGLDRLLAACDHLDRMPGTEPVRLSIHGSDLEANHPSYQAEIASLLARHGQRTVFAGPYRRDELPSLMAAVDWVVVPSIWWENAPLVIEEALRHRRPVLCGDIGGMREKVRPGWDGFHFAAGDSYALAALMARLAGDRPVWNRLQTRMRRPQDQGEWLARHAALYRSLLAGS